MNERNSPSRLHFDEEKRPLQAAEGNGCLQQRRVFIAEQSADSVEQATQKNRAVEVRKREERAQSQTDYSQKVNSPVGKSVDNPQKNSGHPSVSHQRERSVHPVTPSLPSASPVNRPGITDSAPPKAPQRKENRLIFQENQTTPTKMQVSSQSSSHFLRESLRDSVRQTFASANEDDNSPLDALLQGEDMTHSAVQGVEKHYSARKFRKNRQRAGRASTLQKAVSAAKATGPPSFATPHTSWQQKRALRKKYAAAKSGKHASQAVRQAVEGTTSMTGKAVSYVRTHGQGIAMALLAGMLLVVMSSIQACTPLAQSVLESLVIGTYPAEEADVLSAEHAYAQMERDLQDEVDHYERYHPGYDEYQVDAAEIWHDPYVLMAIVSAYFDGQTWTVESAYPVLEKYFDLQYILTEEITSETRYRTETRTETHLIQDETGQTRLVTETHDVEVPYLHRICRVTLENKNLSHLPVYSMSHHAMGMYALYMSTHGNMEGIFAGYPHATPLRNPWIYAIPQETLDANPLFATLMEEANKYVGYPYVWGGASPETSFDCSGFVSYVLTTSGVYNTGRLGATGLYHLCREVPSEEVRPGDLVFFEGTIVGEEGITHCGIYVGDHKMIHCGSPLGYADLTDSYWVSHFHSYGRVPS